MSYFENQTSLDIELKTINTGYVYNILKKGYPVFTALSHVEDRRTGHAILIDYYQNDSYEFYNYYTTTIMPADAEWPDIGPDTSVKELESMFGDIIVERVYDSKTIYKANWGWSDSSVNDIELDAFCFSWNAGKYNYNAVSAKIYNIK
ncbi:MAG: hypothetical protein NC411_06295 [Bacteroides sp.]|nr:hypothetical protein [Bacteroides sp.]